MDTEYTIYKRFKQQVVTNPTSVAVFDGQRTLTYSELDCLADTLSSAFPTKPKFVGVVMDHSVEMIATLIAILKSGAAYVPVEPSFPKERMRFIMRECNVDFIITHRKYSQKLSDFSLLFTECGITGTPTYSPIEDLSHPDNTAYVLYTSGSTGLPKGVMVSNKNVCHYADAFRHEFHIGHSDTMLQHSVCTFDIFVEEVFATLLSGATLAIPSESVKRDIHELMNYIEEHSVSIISGFPYLFLEMNKLPKIPASLRLLISGGDVLRHNYIDRLLSLAEIYNTYGPSETTVCASYFRCNDATPLEDGTYPIGKAVKGVSISILDENLRPVPDGETGEICISGNGVSKGYIGNRENEAFVVMSDGTVTYRSGDLGIMHSDGTILFLRRKDTQVMIEGRRVEPYEVQNVLCSCDGVESGVVRPCTDEQGLSYLAAYIVPKNTVKLCIEEVKQAMSKFLPEYMIPECFIRMKTMPLTPNGKVNVKALPIAPKLCCAYE